ncbi:hypothetical protein [Actinomycetospora callitridis]|uniref:hypothetical protein n=1 Tax=Actinomycetospora callitridis TaxID=913944 RepID=UPI002366FC83|nr:hypothetical protein [Actinomycetospora callitridis]MDD7920150.1 hypothetical protein [Actinomycetospora callitridis]
MSFTPHRWALPPVPEHAGRGERRWHAAAEARARGEIRWIWNEVCSGAHLARRVVPTGTGSFEPPRLGRIRLGPPTTLTVQLRPGQLLADLLAVDDRLAAAFGVTDIEIRRLAGDWLLVELVEGPELGVDELPPSPQRPGPTTDPSVPGPVVPAKPECVRPGRRGSLRPYGAPRSTRWWRTRRR